MSIEGLKPIKIFNTCKWSKCIADKVGIFSKQGIKTICMKHLIIHVNFGGLDHYSLQLVVFRKELYVAV